ncbi:hypothetical protein J4573_43825 [Actinomadura barringtoniae]|uniref:Phosphohydrolase n=1 Tax=Actinomadura barringtoniae TaxID=1427535 RepID=A0A939PKP8_9ACTN|nr:hypothetical protein [Actinomadura barringtoniae]MBO2454082.1 hypothetical protein [Actinomadura barringtoniae]
MRIQTRDPIIDDVLDVHRAAIGPDLPTLRNHIYRSLNYQRLLLGTDRLPDSAALAWAVHDMGIWTDGTWDYLEPSVGLARAFAAGHPIKGLGDTEDMVLLHHRLRPVKDPLVESFRRADLVDVSRGVLRGRISRRSVDAIVAEFPYLGFHRFLVRGLSVYGVRHPARPFPMLRL